MRLLLDTQIVVAFLEERTGRLRPAIAAALADPLSNLSVSVASLWEIAIKTRLGKLGIAPDLSELPDLLESMRFEILPISAGHVLIEVTPEPPTRDPFDRLLLAQCFAEDMRLVTLDRALVNHPAAYAPR